jgi:type I restriction enzyme S subunit
MPSGWTEEEFKKVRIGPKKIEIPEDWEFEALGNISRVIVPQRDKPKNLDGDIPWIRIEDLEGKYINGSKNGRGVSKKTVEKMHLRVYPIGTVLCSCSGNMGICAITENQLVSNQTFAGIVPDKKLNKEYLYYLLSKYKQILQNLATGTTIPYLSKDKFEDFQIPLPSLSEQNHIAEVLSSIDNKIQKEIRYKQKLQNLKKGLMQDLLTGKVRVNNIELEET